MPERVYELLVWYVGPGKCPEDLVFQTENSERLTHLKVKLDRFADLFGKQFAITPTSYRQAISTAVAGR